MSFARYVSVKKSVLFMIAGLIVFLIYLYFYIGIDQIEFVLRNVNSTQYAFYYSLALSAVLVSVFFWSVAWNSILRVLSVHVSYKRAYLYYWVSYFTDLVVPCATVCGELTRLYLVQKETQENYGALASAAVTNRIVAYTIVTLGLYSGAVLILVKPTVSPVIGNVFIIFLVGVTIYMGVLLYLAFFKQAAKNLTGIYLKIIKTVRPKHYYLAKMKRTQKSLSDFYDGFRSFREKPRLLIKPFFFHAISYILGLVVYILIFYALGIPSSNPEFYIVVFFIATAFQDAAASFSVGSLEILLATIFLLYGISPGISGIAAVVLRSAGFWFPLFVGFICVQIVGAKNLLSTKPENLKRKIKLTKEQSKRKQA
ncbi:MAG TPA: lysylphosphatidylglycerol synthase transmembrane domain-containing protein [Candidatus Acidoferrum sp.]|nr:lysylphosphatidylglycerol synthase transmembrane domain-containing protein [Candidatus Acidoferrum sp.]